MPGRIADCQACRMAMRESQMTVPETPSPVTLMATRKKGPTAVARTTVRPPLTKAFDAQAQVCSCSRQPDYLPSWQEAAANIGVISASQAKAASSAASIRYMAGSVWCQLVCCAWSAIYLHLILQVLDHDSGMRCTGTIIARTVRLGYTNKFVAISDASLPCRLGTRMYASARLQRGCLGASGRPWLPVQCPQSRPLCSGPVHVTWLRAWPLPCLPTATPPFLTCSQVRPHRLLVNLNAAPCRQQKRLSSGTSDWARCTIT